MCSYCSRSFKMPIADSLDVNVCTMKSAVLRSMATWGLEGSVFRISASSISKPACTTFNGDLNSRSQCNTQWYFFFEYRQNMYSIPDFVGGKADKNLLQVQEFLVRYCDDVHHATRNNCTQINERGKVINRLITLSERRNQPDLRMIIR